MKRYSVKATCFLLGMLFFCGCGEKNNSPAPETDTAEAVQEQKTQEVITDSTEENTGEPPATDAGEAPSSVFNSIDQHKPEDTAETAEENEWDIGPDFVSRADQLCCLSYDLSIEDILLKYAINMVGDGKYADFEGDIGDIIPEYRDVDLNGDRLPDNIKREGHHYVIEISDGSTFKTDDYSASPNEGEVIEFADLACRNVDEILITHYTFGTAGPTVWDTSVYSNASGEWKAYPVVDKDGVINSEELQEKIELRTGKDYGADSVRIAGAGLDGSSVNLLLDFGKKEGGLQEVDYEAADLYMWFSPEHISEWDGFSFYDFSKTVLVNTWPYEVCGTEIEITPELQYRLNLFLSNFSEQDYRGNGNYASAPWTHFALEWAKLNSPSRIELSDGRYRIDQSNINQILGIYFGSNLEESDFFSADQDNPWGGYVECDDNGKAWYYEPDADGEMYRNNAFTVVSDIQDLGGTYKNNSFYRVEFTVYRMNTDDYDAHGIGEKQYSLSAAEAAELAEKGELYAAYTGMAFLDRWNNNKDTDEYWLWSYYVPSD